MGEDTLKEPGTFTANKCTLTMFTVPAGGMVRKILDDHASTVKMSDKVVGESGANPTGGHLVTALKGTSCSDEPSTCLTLKVPVRIECTRSLANAGLIKIGTNTDVAKPTGETTKEMVETMKECDLPGRVKPAASRNVLDDNLPTVGVPYGALELDVATNAGASGLGAAKHVSE